MDELAKSAYVVVPLVVIRKLWMLRIGRPEFFRTMVPIADRAFASVAYLTLALMAISLLGSWYNNGNLDTPLDTPLMILAILLAVSTLPKAIDVVATIYENTDGKSDGGA